MVATVFASKAKAKLKKKKKRTKKRGFDNFFTEFFGGFRKIWGGDLTIFHGFLKDDDSYVQWMSEWDVLGMFIGWGESCNILWRMGFLGDFGGRYKDVFLENCAGNVFFGCLVGFFFLIVFFLFFFSFFIFSLS